jgi:hypothetical protein
VIGPKVKRQCVIGSHRGCAHASVQPDGVTLSRPLEELYGTVLLVTEKLNPACYTPRSILFFCYKLIHRPCNNVDSNHCTPKRAQQNKKA